MSATTNGQPSQYLVNLVYPIYVFERMRLGHKTTTPYGEKYGKYLYRNTLTNELIASWDSPYIHRTKQLKKDFFKGEDIGYNTDALVYYKSY